MIFSRTKVARIAWFGFVTIMLGLFAWQISDQKEYEDVVPTITLDWDATDFGRAFASVVMFRYVYIPFPSLSALSSSDLKCALYENEFMKRTDNLIDS